MTVAITRLDLSATDLREAAAQTQDAKAARRMLAIALVLEGWSREAAAAACAMDRQTLRDWVHRYNELGLEGLFDQPRRNGPRPRRPGFGRSAAHVPAPRATDALNGRICSGRSVRSAARVPRLSCRRSMSRQ
jgi:hypothetical protein